MIYLGADHGGFALKEKLKIWLREWKLDYLDLGAFKLDPQDDYPQFAFAVAEKIGSEETAKGILICRSSAGMVIAANKIKGVRAVTSFDELSAKLTREHNDANILVLSGDWLTESKSKNIVHTWLTTEFSAEERHKRRIEQINKYEVNN